MTAVGAWTSSELLAVVAARELAGARTVFAGIGLPTLAVSLAHHTIAPDIEIVYESGVTGAHPARLPETIADSVLITGAEAVLGMPALFGYVLQGGHIDVGFLGAAQIDRWGSLNSTVIGDWDAPAVRLPGSGGANEVMANAGEVFVVMRRHDPRSLVAELDFCTSPGPHRSAGAPGSRPRGAGVTRVITDLGILARSAPEDELRLCALTRGTTVDDVRAATGWDLQATPEVGVIDDPTPEELRLLREEVDPQRVYLR